MLFTVFLGECQTSFTDLPAFDSYWSLISHWYGKGHMSLKPVLINSERLLWGGQVLVSTGKVMVQWCLANQPCSRTSNSNAIDNMSYSFVLKSWLRSGPSFITHPKLTSWWLYILTKKDRVRVGDQVCYPTWCKETSGTQRDGEKHPRLHRNSSALD